MDTIRFLAVHSGDELYGSDRVFLDLLTGLDRSRFEPVVVLPSDVPGRARLSPRLRAAGIETHHRDLAVLRRRYLQPLRLPLLAGRLGRDLVSLSRLADQRRCELVYSSTTAVLGAAMMARLTGRPHVWHVHEIVESPAVVSALLRRCLHSLGGEVVAISRAVADWIGPSSCPPTLALNGIDEPRLSATERAESRQQLLGSHQGPLVGWVSRISSWKGHEVFVEMAELMAARHSEAVFLLAGGPVPGETERVEALRAHLRQSRHGDRIRYLGEVADGPRLIGALDVLAHCPTRPEPLGRVVQEALWQGVPVLAVRAGGLPELVEDGRTGRLLSDPSPSALADALCEMLAPSVLATMGERAREDAARFSMPAFIATMSGVMERALAMKRSGT